MKNSKFNLIYEQVLNTSNNLYQDFFREYLIQLIKKNTSLMEYSTYDFNELLYEDKINCKGKFLFALEFYYYILTIEIDSNQLNIIGTIDQSLNGKEFIQQYSYTANDTYILSQKITNPKDLLDKSWIEQFIDTLLEVDDNCRKLTKEENFTTK